VIPLLRIAALAVAAAIAAWPVTAYLDDSDSRRTPAGAAVAAPIAPGAVLSTAPTTALPWSPSHQAGPGELDAVHLDRLEVSLTRLYAMRQGNRGLV
jgi:hypothetical protein